MLVDGVWGHMLLKFDIVVETFGERGSGTTSLELDQNTFLATWIRWGALSAMARLLQGQRVCLQRARREPWRTGPILAYTNLFPHFSPETLELEFPFAAYGVVCGFPLRYLDGVVSRLLPNVFVTKFTEEILSASLL